MKHEDECNQHFEHFGATAPLRPADVRKKKRKIQKKDLVRRTRGALQRAGAVPSFSVTALEHCSSSRAPERKEVPRSTRFRQTQCLYHTFLRRAALRFSFRSRLLVPSFFTASAHSFST